MARRYAEAAQAFARISTPDHTHHAFLAAAFAQMGDAIAATAHAEQVAKRAPGFSVQAYLDTLHYKQPSDREHHREGLLKAGLSA
jgi:adenylate cyclase